MNDLRGAHMSNNGDVLLPLVYALAIILTLDIPFPL